MYCIFKVFYIILVYYDYENIRRIENIFTLTFCFNNTNIKNIITNLKSDIKTLNEGMIIKIGGYNILVRESPFILIADITKTMNNSEFMRYNINKRY